MVEPAGHDARLISLPEGVQVMRDNKIRYHWYNRITGTSRRRLWGLMDNCLRLASNPDIHIWKDQRRTNTTTESITNQPPQQRWRVETLQFGYYDIKYAPTRREAREIRRAALLRPQTEKSHVVDTQKPQGRRGTDEYPFYGREIMKARR